MLHESGVKVPIDNYLLAQSVFHYGSSMMGQSFQRLVRVFHHAIFSCSDISFILIKLFRGRLSSCRGQDRSTYSHL